VLKKLHSTLLHYFSVSSAQKRLKGTKQSTQPAKRNQNLASQFPTQYQQTEVEAKIRFAVPEIEKTHLFLSRELFFFL
jgi:hypothetical protein